MEVTVTNKKNQVQIKRIHHCQYFINKYDVYIFYT